MYSLFYCMTKRRIELKNWHDEQTRNIQASVLEFYNPSHLSEILRDMRNITTADQSLKIIWNEILRMGRERCLGYGS